MNASITLIVGQNSLTPEARNPLTKIQQLNKKTVVAANRATERNLINVAAAAASVNKESVAVKVCHRLYFISASDCFLLLSVSDTYSLGCTSADTFEETAAAAAVSTRQ